MSAEKKIEVTFQNVDHFKTFCSERPNRCLFIYKEEIFDVTEFLLDHPGGPQILQEISGSDITEIFHDDRSHEHSEVATNMLLRYKIGRLQSKLKNKDSQGNGTVAYPQITDSKVIYNNFTIDLKRGLVPQSMELKLSQYIHMIENPIYLPYCRLFDSGLFEAFSRNKYYMIPIIWTPLVIYMIYLALTYQFETPSMFDGYLQLSSPNFSGFAAFITFLFGLGLWTLLEYELHRYAFHFESKIPDNKYLILLHFVIHGVHHTIPMDPDRLVFPPVLFIISYALIYNLAKFFMAGAFLYMAGAGIVLGYICYDVTHYFIHHSTPNLAHFKEMKKYHHKHHYLDDKKGYGITSKTWDYVFHTEFTEKNHDRD
jgi:4-hydroxysphinganine ceramide fatty acyl 2-hydroxylase